MLKSEFVYFRTHEIASKIYKKSLAAVALTQTLLGSLRRSRRPNALPRPHPFSAYAAYIHSPWHLNHLFCRTNFISVVPPLFRVLGTSSQSSGLQL